MAKHERTEEIVTTTFNPEELKPKMETIIRTMIFFLSWANGALAFFGLPQLDVPEDAIWSFFEALYVIGSGIFVFGASIWAAWKDNSFTKAALVGDKVKEEVKAAASLPKGEH